MQRAQSRLPDVCGPLIHDALSFTRPCDSPSCAAQDLQGYVKGQAQLEKSSKPDALRWRTAIAASLSAKLALIIRASSIRQALWGIASAGPQRALQYALAKARKGFSA